jgi:hypothetical protein
MFTSPRLISFELALKPLPRSRAKVLDPAGYNRVTEILATSNDP